MRVNWQSYFNDPQAQVAISRMPFQHDLREHSHNFIEIVLVVSGSGQHLTEGMSQVLHEGDVLVINSSRSHAYKDTQSLSIINILIREDIFQETEKELSALPGYHALFTLEPVRWRQRKFTSHFRLKTGELKLALSWVDALEEETRRKSEGGLLMARSWIILLIGLLARQYDKRTSDHPRLEMRLGRVLSKIDQGFCEKFTVAELARLAVMSERTFLRRFREATGFSPNEYIIRVRIRRAMEMLEARVPDLSISEIAFRCGFEDSNYFSRQFRRLIGTNPRKHRSKALVI